MGDRSYEPTHYTKWQRRCEDLYTVMYSSDAMKNRWLMLVMFSLVLGAFSVIANPIEVRMEEGEYRTFDLDSHRYLVEVLIIEDTTPATVTFKVNNQVSRQLTEQQSQLIQGLFINVLNIELNEGGEAGSGDLVTFRMTYDETPPEARIVFDPLTGDLVVSGRDNLDPVVSVEYTNLGMVNRWEQRRYVLIDDSENNLILRASYQNSDSRIRFMIDSLEYNNRLSAVVENIFEIRHNEHLTEQRLTASDLSNDFSVAARYVRAIDQTTIGIGYRHRMSDPIIYRGLRLVSFITDQGTLDFEL